MMPPLAALALALTATSTWQPLAAGFELGHIPPRPKTHDVGALEVVRADPRHVTADVATVAERGGEPRTAAQWATEVGGSGVVVVTNAGMFDADHTTHTGYFSAHGRVLSARWNKYQSVFVFDPAAGDAIAMRLLDRDAEADAAALDGYRGQIQNLRLVAAPSRNKWGPNGRAWSEAALATDRQGRTLIVFAREPHSMTDFNARIIAQLGVVAAQHLEGGPEASLTVRAPGRVIDLAGSFETGFFDDSNHVQWPLPNVLVLRSRDVAEKRGR